MNAKEAMMALLDGKIVTGFNFKLKLNGFGELVVEGVDSWNPSSNDLNYIIDVVKEYPLTFKDALKAMLDGKIVESDVSKRRYQLMNMYEYHETYVEVSDESCTPILTEIKLPEQIGKWKVVE